MPSLAICSCGHSSPDGDVVDGARAELAVELLGRESAQVVDVVGPQVQHVVPGEAVALLHHHHLRVGGENWQYMVTNGDSWSKTVTAGHKCQIGHTNTRTTSYK